MEARKIDYGNLPVGEWVAMDWDQYDPPVVEHAPTLKELTKKIEGRNLTISKVPPEHFVGGFIF